jgi:peptidase M48-like protein/PDZ domain-containing protein
LRRDSVRSLERQIGPGVVKFLWPLLLIAGCSTQQYDVSRGSEPVDSASMVARLHDVGFPLLVAAAEWCPYEQEPTFGFLLKNDDISKNQEGEGAEHMVSVAYVHPRLPAALGGLAPGDRVVQVNARTVTQYGAEDVMILVRRMAVARIQPLQLEVMRAKDRRTLTMWAVPACQFTLQLVESDQINGITDGRRIGLTTGAMRFLRSDDELAWVLAHEIAHNVLSHVQNAKLSAMLSAFLGATVGSSVAPPASPPQRSLESQADYVGSYIMARAGYDLQAIKRLWHRVEDLPSRSLRPEVIMTHPTTAERLAALEETLKEIEEKRAYGETLQPVLEKTQ